MDKIRPFLIALNVHRFWVACGTIVVVGLAIWLFAALSLNKERVANIKKVDSHFSDVDRLGRVGAELGKTGLKQHPNTTIQSEMDQLIQSGRVAAFEGWRLQYNNQNQEGLFDWPEVLGDGVRDAFRALRPIERKVAFPTPRDFESGYRDYCSGYKNYIEKQLPILAQSIGSRWRASADQASEESSAKPSAEIVVWDSSNQSHWVDKITQFTGKAGNSDPNNTPTVLQVLYAQEDLWVLEALFDIIKQTNGDADAQDLAAIKEISQLVTGPDAGTEAGQILMLESTDSAAAGGRGGRNPGGRGAGGRGGGRNPGGRGGGGGGGRGGRGGGSTGDESAPDPADNRYVDKDYQPLTGKDLRSAFSKPTSDNAYLIVAKRIPVRMRLVIDERSIMHFLAECANSKTPLEVRQVRLLGSADGAAAATSGGRSTESGGRGGGASGRGGGSAGRGSGSAGRSPGGAPTANRGGDGGSRGGGGGRGGASSGRDSGGRGGSSSSSAQTTVQSHYNISVEIYGIIHIFNPVDQEHLKVESTEEDPAGQGNPVPATTPVP